ncbi:MAG: hypothetical protein ABIO69_01775 [Sphingomicrobium sp.]
MAKTTQSNRAGTRGASRTTRSNNHNPEGRNQYNNGFMSAARERPMAAAATAAGVVAAGVFLWSKRAQISEQLNTISDQIGEWSEDMISKRQFETVGGDQTFDGSNGEFIASSKSGGNGSSARSARRATGSTAAADTSGTIRS